MANCHLCGNKISILKLARADGHSFCIQCVKKWPEERRSRIIQNIFSDKPPIIIFRISRVTDATLLGEITTHVGDLIFMDKGICFLPLAKHIDIRKVLPGGLIPELIGHSTEQKAYTEGENSKEKQTHPSDADTLRVLLENAPPRSVRYYPRDKITLLKYGLGGFWIHTGKGNWNYEFDKNIYLQHENQIRAYSHV